MATAIGTAAIQIYGLMRRHLKHHSISAAMPTWTMLTDEVSTKSMWTTVKPRHIIAGTSPLAFNASNSKSICASVNAKIPAYGLASVQCAQNMNEDNATPRLYRPHNREYCREK